MLGVLNSVSGNNKLLFYRPTAADFSPVLVFVGSFLVYLFALAPTVYSLDSAELSTVAYNLGVPHATGYPLYVLIGKLFTLLPVGDVGYRLNLMSTVFGASTIALIYLLAFFASRRVILSLAVSGCLAAANSRRQMVL